MAREFGLDVRESNFWKDNIGEYVEGERGPQNEYFAGRIEGYDQSNNMIILNPSFGVLFEKGFRRYDLIDYPQGDEIRADSISRRRIVWEDLLQERLNYLNRMEEIGEAKLSKDVGGIANLVKKNFIVDPRGNPISS